MARYSGIRAGGSLAALLICLLAFASPAAAQEPLVVTTTEDDGDGECDDTCSLRDAVAEAGSRGDATIALKAEPYSLTRGELVFLGDFTIQGAGARATTIDSNGEGRIAYVAEGSQVAVNDVTVTGGYASGQVQDAGLGGGFRVAAAADLLLERATLTNNFADSAGGAISSAGTVQLVQSTVSFNGAGTQAALRGRGGGIHVESSGNAVLKNATVSSNVAFSVEQDPQGGGVYTAGSFSIEHTTIAHNEATEGAGLYQARASGELMSMHNTLFARNSGPACGGTPEIIEESHNLSDDKTCALAGGLEEAYPGILDLDDHGGPTDTHALDSESAAIDAADKDHCLDVDQRGFGRRDSCDIGAVERRPQPVVTTTVDGDDANCEPDDCTLREALQDSERGAVIMLPEGDYELTLGELQLRGDRSIVGQNARTTAIVASGAHRVIAVAGGDSMVSGVRISGGEVVDGEGGGILVSSDAALSVVDSSVEGNSAATGGGIMSLGGLVVVSSTIASNEASVGGGLFLDLFASALLMNSTVSRNTASSAGGGIANVAGSLEAVNVTIAGNEAHTGGGVYGDARQIDGSFFVGESSLISTIVATNTGGACAWSPDHDRFPDHSLADDESCFEPSEDNLVEADPGIGALSSSFGPTDVHPLVAGSPAIDAGNDEFCEGNDQRGAPRIQGAACDIGAFEGVTQALHVFADVLDGPAQPSDFTVRVHSGDEVVASGPGSASGTPFVLAPGDYRVSVSGPDGYVRAFSEGCDARGEVVLADGQDASCTFTLDHVTAPAGGCLDYATFGQATGLNLVGDAALAENVLRLNPDAGGVGAAWFGARMPVADGFTTDFEFRITPPGGGADGLAFVIQNHAIDALGVSGGGLGYHEVPNSLAVELDTFWNFEYGEPSANHVSVHSRGTEPNSAGPDGQLGGAAALANFKDGELHRVRLVYVPGTLDVFVDDMTTPKLSVDVDLSSLLQLHGDSALVGFTAATGGVTEGHQIESWRLCSAAPPATLRVVTNVINDNGGTRGPGDFNVHVRSGGSDVAGSPRAGGGSYTLAAGTYAVAADAVAGYALSVGGDCGGDGTVTLAATQSKDCTITANDVAAQGSAPPPEESPPPEELPPPEAGEEVNALPKSGTVRVRVAGANRFVELEEGQQIPVGSVVDTTNGRVTIVAAGGQSADFFDGIFRISQGKGAKPLTTLTLVEALSCPKAGKAVAAAKRKKRRLWGDGSGKFRTEGKHSAATVVGTRWLVEDRCTSTLTKVARGKVNVRDFAKKKTVTVRAGKQYVARAKR